MGGEIADAVVFFGAGVQDGGRVVREAREVGAVLLREKQLGMAAFFGIIKLDGVVAAGGEEELARIVEVEGCDGSFGFGEFELLSKSDVAAQLRSIWDASATLVGRNVPITSEVFCVEGGPPGGGGGTGGGPAIARTLGITQGN